MGSCTVLFRVVVGSVDTCNVSGCVVFQSSDSSMHSHGVFSGSWAFKGENHVDVFGVCVRCFATGTFLVPRRLELGRPNTTTTCGDF